MHRSTRSGKGPSAAPSRQAAFAALAVGLTLVVVGCGGGSDPGDAAGTTRAVETGASPSRAEVSVAPRRAPRLLDLPPGTVRVEPGPFTDRVQLTSLRFAHDAGPAVTGRIRNVVDVSELIVLELQADFYDSRGRFLGTGRQTLEDAHAGAGETPLEFTIRAKPAQPAAVAALLSIPQLVNE